jgi:methylmalonyl-CoA epimerase
MPHVMRIKRIHHLTVAVRDAERAGDTFAALFGEQPDEARSVQAFSVRTRDVPIGDDILQLASPLVPDSPLLRFIERKGEGFYNLALEVDDLDAALAELTARGIKVSEPIEATPGARSAFITMHATHGLSIQLVELTASTTPEEPLDLTPDEWSDEG